LLQFHFGAGRDGGAVAREDFNHHFQIGGIAQLQQWRAGGHDAGVLFQNAQDAARGRRF